MTSDPARAETAEVPLRRAAAASIAGTLVNLVGRSACSAIGLAVLGAGLMLLLGQGAGRTALLAAIGVAWLGSAAAAIPVAWAIRQPPATLAAAALASLGVRLAVTLVAAWIVQSNVGLPSEPFVWWVALSQFLLLGLDTAAVVGLFRRVSGG